MEQFDHNVKVLKTLGHPLRFALAKALHEHGEQNVGTLVEVTQSGQSIVSQHLSKLKSAGIADSRRKGTQVFYSLVDPFAIAICSIKE